MKPKRHTKHKSLGLALGCAVAAFTALGDAGLNVATAQFSSLWIKTGKTINGSDVYIRQNSIRTMTSVEFSNTTYRRGDFSYTDYSGLTTRKRLVADCKESSYKNGDKESGYYVDLSWITPFTRKDSIESIGYHYLCPEASDPWVEFYEDSGSLRKIYYINKLTITEANNPRYGPVRSGIMVEGYKDSRIQSKVFMFYVACRRGLSGTRDMYMYMKPSNPSLSLSEDNPGSLGEAWSETVCGIKKL